MACLSIGRSLFELSGGHGMRGGDGFVQLLAGGFHGFAANGGGDGGVHHQLGKMARGLIEGDGGFTNRDHIVALLDGGETVTGSGDGGLFIGGQLLPCGIPRGALDGREN